MKQGPVTAPLPIKILFLHTKHQIYIGTRYEICASAHASETVIDLHHGQPATFIVLLTYTCSAFFFLFWNNHVDKIRSPRFKHAYFHESKNGPMLILGAGIFEINPTPQQSADIFRKNTSARSLSSWHPQSDNRAEATAGEYSDLGCQLLQ